MGDLFADVSIFGFATLFATFYRFANVGNTLIL